MYFQKKKENFCKWLYSCYQLKSDKIKIPNMIFEMNNRKGIEIKTGRVD